MGEHFKATIESRLRPGEKLIWSGKPQHESGTPTRKRNPWIFPAVQLVVIIAAVWVLKAQLPQGTLDRFLGGNEPGMGAVIGISAAIFIVFFLPRVLKSLKLDNQSRLDRYLLSLQYAITDQRLIIMQGDKTESYGPEDLTQLRLRDRGDGRQDVQFQDQERAGNASRREDAVGWEQRRVGFKMLPDAEAVKQRIEQWIEGHLEAVSEQADTFASGEPESGRTFSNPSLGLTFLAPEGWDIQVRKKAKPYGETFVDKAHWRAIGDTDDWNLARLDGPMDSRVEFELFETEKPLVTYRKMTKSRLVRMTAGKPIDSDPEFQLNGMSGYRLTYRDNLQMDKGRSGEVAGIAAVAKLSHKYLLHDGRRQLYVETQWPEGSGGLAETVEAIVRSISVV